MLLFTFFCYFVVIIISKIKEKLILKNDKIIAMKKIRTFFFSCTAELVKFPKVLLKKRTRFMETGTAPIKRT